ncbi:MAG TPA: SAM-dependent chlorinase/fluorinase [Thermoanaerobaculia bacterium]
MRRIALLTDFGTRDPYVASMKGVLAARTAVAVEDLTHEIAPFDVWEAAWFLRTAAPWWPVGTIFVCVVDPGVGSGRRILAAEVGEQVFLAPDNGLLTFVVGAMGRIGEAPAASKSDVSPVAHESPVSDESHRSHLSHRSDRLFSVENTALFLPGTSTTFHGRDRFAPVAAALANGLPLEELGPPVTELKTLSYEAPVIEGDITRGTVVHIDRFGNVITDVEPPSAPYALTAGALTIDRIETSYAEAAPGPFLIAGSGGTVEISVSNANAAKDLQLSRGDRLVVWRIPPHPRGESSRR